MGGGADIQPVTGDEVVLRADGAADDVAAFEDQDLASRLGEIAGAGEAVMARAYYHDVVMRHTANRRT